MMIKRAIVKREFPTEGHESFLSAIRRIDPEIAQSVLAAGRQYHSAAKLVGYPTLAIAGMLNSGKTSLVATFLSDEGRARTLRGASNDDGTHRFVLWLPSAWRKDAELWGLLMSDLGDAIGMPPEMLSKDPAEAHGQYNNREGDSDSLSIPLVATDPGLDDAGIGLLDCPDIVSDEAFGLGSPQDRRALLGRAATFCSAFIVVSSAESSRDSTLGDLLRIAADLMPGIPRLLAVNKIRPRQTPDQVLDTFGPLARGHGIETVFAAYDFDVPASKPFIPADDETIALAFEQDADPQPVFFSIDKDPDNNPPAAIEDERLLRALPERLDRSESSDKFILAREHSLRTYLWESAYASIDRDADQSIESTEKARQCLMDASLEFFARREPGGKVMELRLHQSQRIIRQLTESFALTAPWYARWGVRMNGWLQRAVGGASDFVKQLTPTAIAKRTAGEIKEKFQRGEYGGLMTPERLQVAIDRFGGPVVLTHWFDEKGQVHNKLQWDEAAEAAVTRYERDDFTTLDPRRLDDAVRQMWAEVPMRKKLAAGLTPLAAMLAAFGGVLMIPFDFGSTAAIAYASIPELFAALGLTTLATMWAGGQNTRNVGQQAARQQLSDFHSVLCDTYGVARPDIEQTIMVSDAKETLPKSQIARREAVGPLLVCIVYAMSFDKNCSVFYLVADLLAREFRFRFDSPANVDAQVTAQVAAQVAATSTAQLAAPGEQFLRRVRVSATNVLGESQTGRQVLELCDEHAEARRMILQDRSPGATVIAVVGATGQGKSWLIRQMVRNSSVANSIQSGNNAVEATEKLHWVGPVPPVDLDSRFEQYLHCEASKMQPIGVRYLLVDSPGSTDDRRAISAVASRALSLASVLLLVVRRDQLRSQAVGMLATASEGTIVIPVINAVRDRDASLDTDIDGFIAQMRTVAPTSAVVAPIILDDFEVADRTESTVGEMAATAVAQRLQDELGNSWEGDRRRSTRLAALDGRFRAALNNVLSDRLPGLTLAVRRLHNEATKLPVEVAETLVGTGGPLRAAVRSRLRLSLMTDTPAICFPYRSQLGLLNLTHGAWDRVLLSLSGSLPSLVSAVWSSTKNLANTAGAEDDVRDGLRRRSAAAVTDRLGPLAARFRDELAQLRQQGDQRSAIDEGDSRSQVAYLGGIDALQEESQRIFDSEVDREAMSPTAALACAVIGAGIFWFLMAGPIVALYSQYFRASFDTFQDLGGELDSFPRPEFSMIFTSLLVSVLPTALFAMLVLSFAQRRRSVINAEQRIRDQHRQTIAQLQESGVLRLRWDDPLLTDAEFLLSAGADETGVQA